MNVVKKDICTLNNCYAVSECCHTGTPHLIFAADDNEPCYLIDIKTFDKKILWNNMGGVMSILPIPGRQEELLAIHQFNPIFKGEKAALSHIHYDGKKWKTTLIAKRPFLHRFDFLERNGQQYILCCTLCTKKKNLADWSSPGGIYVAPLPENFSNKIDFKPISENIMTRNHGYWHVESDKFSYGLTACDQGIFQVTPPKDLHSNWNITKILDIPASDIALCDIDMDGEIELALIHPFHGNAISIFKKYPTGYQSIFSISEDLAFCHVIWGGLIRGKKVFIAGCREQAKSLFLIYKKNNKWKKEIIDKGSGPSNIRVINNKDFDIIATANREKGKATVYYVYEL